MLISKTKQPESDQADCRFRRVDALQVCGSEGRQSFSHEVVRFEETPTR